jgi:hypothetical protein
MVESRLSEGVQLRDSKWTQSIAVGSKAFIEETQNRLGFRAKGRKIIGEAESYMLREPAVAYGVNFDHENDTLRLKNTYFWNESD